MNGSVGIQHRVDVVKLMKVRARRTDNRGRFTNPVPICISNRNGLRKGCQMSLHIKAIDNLPSIFRTAKAINLY